MSLTTFRRWWMVFLIALTTAPYLWNWWSTPAGFSYTWILPPYPEDSLGYMAWAQQAAAGAVLFKLKYTALPHSAFLFHPLFLVCGWLGALFGGNVALVFLIAKAAGTAWFLSIFYRYTDYLKLRAGESIAASVFVGISTGVGGLLMWIGLTNRWAVLSTDLWMPEVSTFWALLWNPLFPFSLALMTMSILRADRGTRDARTADLLVSGLSAGALTLLHPYSAPLLFAFTVIFVVVRQRQNAWSYLLRYFVLASPFAIYIAALSRLQPLVARHSVAGQMQSPAPLEYLLGFGLPLLFVLCGAMMQRNALLKKYWQLLLWFALAFAFAYAPVWFQRKLIFGAHIPLSILAGVVAVSWLNHLTSRVASIPVAVLFLPLLAGTSIYALVRQDRDVRENLAGAYYLSAETIAALAKLREVSRRDDIVLATETTSRFIPALTGDTVLWGHWAMAVDRQERLEQIRRLLDVGSGMDDETRAREFWDIGIKFIFADGELKLSIEQHPFLWSVILKRAHKVFANDRVAIYQHDDD